MGVKAKKFSTLGVMIVVVAVLAGCGSSSNNPAAGGGGGSAASAGGGGGGGRGPGNYGVLSCFSGRLASLGQAMLQGSQVAKKAIDAAGGVMGHKVSLTQEDTQCDLADAVPATQQLLSKGVTGVIGPETQEIAAVEPILKNSKIVDEFQGGDPTRDHQT
ncbi:MAG: ABC transporter substrate-binding protein, partial [Solirubrobacteraceae bacterium]